MLEIYSIITKNNLKQLKVHIIGAVIFLASIPVFFTVSYLNEDEVIYLAEHYICLIGIILLAPVFLAEDNKMIRELLLSKKMPLTLIWLKRIMFQVILLAVLIFICLSVLQRNNCVFSFFRIYYAIYANAIFLGGLGILSFAVFNNWILGYMIPLFCYLLGLVYNSNSIVIISYLISLQNYSSYEKHYLILVGICCIVISLIFLEKTKKVMKN